MTRGTFRYCGAELIYLDHPYNRAAQNMRTVEIPIARWYLARYPRPAAILEVGNVLSHYGDIDWPVLDVRERGPQVINADVMAWEPPHPFDFILSISTVEHVGYGRHAALTGPVTPAEVLARLRSWLTPGGLCLATVPTAYNPTLDEQLRAGTLGADEVHALRRVSEANEWAECPLDEALAMPYCLGRHRWGGGMIVILCHEEH